MPVSVRPRVILFVLLSTGTGSGAGGDHPRWSILILRRFPSISACVRTVKPEGDARQGGDGYIFGALLHVRFGRPPSFA
jgi:hypothetical protein